MFESIDHVNIVVQDLEKMERFYADLLGLRPTKRFAISGSWIDQTVGLEGVKAEGVYLDLPSGPRLELIRYLAPAGAQPQGIGISNTPGLRHLAFRVRDIEDVIQKLRAAGVSFLSQMQIVPDAQVTYAGGARKHLVYFRDPENNLLELCEYKP